MVPSGLWIVFVSSLIVAITSATGVENIESVVSVKLGNSPTQTMKTGYLPAIEQTPPPETDSPFRDAIKSLSIYTSPPSSIASGQSGVIATTTSFPLTETETSTSAMGSDVQMHATSITTSSNMNTPSMISPELGDMTELGNPLGVVTTTFSVPVSTDTAFTSEGIVPSRDPVISSANPATVKTETTSASTTLDSASWFEPSSTVASEASSTETAVNSHHSSSNALSRTAKIAAIVAPIVGLFLIGLGIVIWWFVTHRKEQKRADRLASKAIWLDQDYIDSIRKKMMGMDEEKVSNPKPDSSAISKLTTIGRTATSNMGKRLSVIGDSIPGVRRTSRRVSQADYLEMSKRRHARVFDDEDLFDTALVIKAHGENHNQNSSDNDIPTTAKTHDDGETADNAITFASGALPSTPMRHSMIEFPSAPLYDSEMADIPPHRRSASVVSRLGHRVERAIRRRSGIEELHG